MAKYEAHARDLAATRTRLERIEARVMSFAQQREARREEVPEPVEWAERVAGFKLDAWQADFMRSTARYELMLCTRQGGKTTIVSLKAAYLVRFFPRVLGVLSPTLVKSQILFRRARRWLIISGAKFTRATATELEISGGGHLICFPGDRPDMAARGETLDDLIIDEASRIKDALIASASPTQATKRNASETWLSTPSGARGVFYEESKRPEGQPWRNTRITADQCPRISAEFLARMRERLGEQMFQQEFYCKFVASAGSLFAADDLEAMFSAPFHEVELPEEAEGEELVF